MNAREVALRIINDIYNNGAYSNIALARELGRQSLTEQDRRFTTELVYGTIKAGETLDWMVGRYVNRSLDKISPVILNIIRLGMYQLFFLDKVPASAACNQSVELAKKYGHVGTVKFVNGVLRNAARNPERVVYPDKEAELERYLALKYFHPQWIVKRWIERLGREQTEALCEINNSTPFLSLRTNTLKVSREELLQILFQEGVEASPSEQVPEGVICRTFPSLSSLKSLQNGLFQIQDESSMLVAHVMDPKPGELIMDVCAAPGGKSTHIAALMGGQGTVIAGDVHEHKLSLIQENAERSGINNIKVKAWDATQIGEMYPQIADRVLVDAPCSGLGVLRRKPDSRWRKSEEMIQELSQLQQLILNNAAQCVKVGGVLVYSTCTTEPEENQQVIENFLTQSEGRFILQNAGQFLPQKRKEDMVQIWPHVDKMDGFFIGRLLRVK